MHDEPKTPRRPKDTRSEVPPPTADPLPEVSVTDFKARLGDWVARVREGHPLVLTARRRAVARVIPAFPAHYARAERMVALARALPSAPPAVARHAWDPAALDRWAADAPPGSRAAHAARFLLSVWRPGSPFHPADALRAWDDRHRAAFAAWAADPWWCRPEEDAP